MPFIMQEFRFRVDFTTLQLLQTAPLIMETSFQAQIPLIPMAVSGGVWSWFCTF
jgi:hypothetical protein